MGYILFLFLSLPPLMSTSSNAGTIRKPPPQPAPKLPKLKSKSTPKFPKKPRPKPLPVVKWTHVPVKLSLEDAETRLYIREFLVRFADLFDPFLSKANLEELDEIGGARCPSREDHAHAKMASWVSESCIKSMILALLSLLEKELHGPLAAVRFFPSLNYLTLLSSIF